ncbi:GATOR complex protein Iml1-like isoform X1 [Haliotis rufescens]|uniref:GATOR complex protein Iml1-like isoform X1 n=1 Tax=Haliotis rufescens TaxID=6454 RepID=UPI00201F8EED|nr:GATOR complex protein Iml1-like isoform X1 [Haliotis rufescens]
MKTFKLVQHQRKDNAADIQISLKDFPNVRAGDVLEVYNPEVEFSRLLVQITKLPEEGLQQLKAETVSIETTIATAFQLRAYQDVYVNKIDPKHVALDLVELLYKEQYYSRSDMWRMRKSLVGKCVYLNKKIEYAEMRATVNEMWSKGDMVACGVISEDTRIVFRSSTAVVQIFIQMSTEMWDFDINGDLYFEKAVNGFLTDLFAKWKDQNCCHDVTIVLFSRTFYGARSLDDFPTEVQECLQVDYQGRIYEDFYRVVIQNERYEEWTNTLKLLRKYFNRYQMRVLHYHKQRGFRMPPAWNSKAAQGNFLETLNMSLNLFENYYLDRNFDRTGKVSVVITPGPGVFEVDRELTNITKQRTIDCGVGSDLVCMGEQPLHAAPLFKFHSKNAKNCLEVGDDYNIPHWMNHSFYTSKNQIQTHFNSSFVPRIKPPPEVLEFLAKEPENNEIALVNTSNDADDDKFPFVDYDEYDAQVFKLPSRTAPRAVSGRSSSFYGTHARRRNCKSTTDAGQGMPGSRIRHISDDFMEHCADKVVKKSSSSAVGIPSRSLMGEDLSQSAGCYPIFEKTLSRESVNSSESEEFLYTRPVVGSAGSPVGFSHRLQNFRPQRALINPFAPSRMRFKMTSNRRRWVHAFPTDPQGAAVQTHHYLGSGHSDDTDDLSVQQPTREVIQGAQMAVESRKRRSVSRQESLDDIGEDHSLDGLAELSNVSPSHSTLTMSTLHHVLSSASAEFGRCGSRGQMTSQDGFWLWGPTGEQPWSPDMTTGWDWRPLTQVERERADSQLIKPILTSDPSSQTFCAGISVDWKSLTIPASLPTTTDFFPDQRSLHYDYVVSDYNLLPDDVNAEIARERNPPSEDEAFYRRKPLSTVHVFRELVYQRLAQGFQLIKISRSSSPRENTTLGSSPQYHHATVLTRARPRVEQSEEYYLSIGRIFHKLNLTGPTITVTRYRPRHNQPQLHFKYQYRFQAPDSYCYDVSWTEFSNEKLENYVWNHLDHYICTRGEGDFGLVESLKYWRSRFFLLPSNNSATKKIIEGHHRCDIYEKRSGQEVKTLISGFVRYLETINKLKRTHQARRSKLQPDGSASSGETSPGKQEADSQKGSTKEDGLSRATSAAKLIEAFTDAQTGLAFLPKQPGLAINTFISAEAVLWCQMNVAGIETTKDAVDKLQELVDDKLILHASGNPKHKFIFGFYLYFIPPAKGKPDILNLPNTSCPYNMCFQNEFCEVTVLHVDQEAPKRDTFYLPSGNSPEREFQAHVDWRVESDLNKQGWGQQLGKLNICAQKATRNHKYVNVDVDTSSRSERTEWATARYHAYYSPHCAFELQIQWMVATGGLLGDLVYSWARKATSCGFHLLPVPVDPFALPYTQNSDPLRGPIFVPLNVNSLQENGLFSEHDEQTQQTKTIQFQLAIIQRFGFLRAVVEMPESKTDLHRVRTPDEYRYQFVHCTGGMFILVPDIKTSSPITIEAPYSSSFGKTSSSDLHKDYIARQTSSTLTDEPQSEIGFLWSWNFMLSKRWRSGNTGDEHFQDKMLADFRVFCSNADNRLTQFWTNYVEE